MFPLRLLGVAIGALSTAAFAYDVFHPTQASGMREFSVDRPDTTESPYTVDAGHFQVEWEILSAAHGRINGVGTGTLTSSANLKLGLTDQTDLQLVLEPHTRERTTVDGVRHDASGMNDTEVRLKINLWGNDGGDTAFGLLPFIRLPTHSDAFGKNGKTEGGLILPAAFDLPDDWKMGAMLEADAIRNTANDRYILRELQSVTFGRDIHGPLAGFLELVRSRRHEAGAGNEWYFDSGLIVDLGPDTEMDVGFNRGLNANAQDWRYFVGFSRRY